MESLFDYGARAGIWRLLDLFDTTPITAFCCGMALERAPEVGEALATRGHEVAGHGWRWLDYAAVPETVERDHIARTVAVIERTAGRRPVGWYTGQKSLNTRRLLVEHGGFLYDSDDYGDDVPFVVHGHVVVPYALDTNDVRFGPGAGFESYLRDALDQLLAEGGRMLSVGLHPRLSGRPGRARTLARFVDYARSLDDVWIARREDIARRVQPSSNVVTP